MASRGKYRNFAELMRQETLDRDYSISLRRVERSSVAILAPHGGQIEFLTSELAHAIAGDNHNLYVFAGMKAFGNGELHITSAAFDEPLALEMVTHCDRVVTVHGLAGGARQVKIGGRDAALRQLVNENLKNAGFNSEIETGGAYGGTDADNICNRGASGAGVQIEITAGLREVLRAEVGEFRNFVKAVRLGLTG